MTEEQLNEVISIGKEVEELINSKAWQSYISPLLDKMIVDVVGGKINGRWTGAPQAIEEQKVDLPTLKYYLGYKAGLIVFHESIMSMIDSKEKAIKILNDMEKEPLIDNSVSDYDTTLGEE